MTRLGAFILACLVLEGCADAPGEWRQVTMLDGFIVCEPCHLEIVGIDTLEAESDRGLVPGYPSDVETVADGRLAVTFMASGEPLWFDASGQIIGAIGRLGDGPGEYRRPSTLLAVPDSLVVIEALRRITVIDLETASIRTLQSLPIQIRDAAVVSWPHRVVVAYGHGPPADSVASIMMFDFSGDAPELIGEIERWALRDGEYSMNRRLVAPGTSNAFWALDYADYRIVHRDSNGRVINEIRRNADWAPDGTGDLGYGPSKAPPALMDVVHQDSRGRVWTVARIPREDWELAWSNRGVTELRSEMPAGSGPRRDELWRSRIEAFSPDLDSLLVSEVLPGVFEGFMSDGRLVRYSETDLGFPVIELLTVRIDDQSGPGSS